ncbi:MAG: UDP-N-acetylmuramate dehydrogenase [Planctomycetes bacterium]|nr:UDP-N-acetylmuramate dehydrogenase [Planctomycetota bacterium]
MLSSSASTMFSDLEVEITPDAPIGPMTWYGIGGHADILIRPLTIEALTTLVMRCRRTRSDLRVFGKGANLLVADDGVSGIVITLDTPAFREITYNAEGDVHTMRAMAGADMAATLMDATRRGLEGLSQMAGIPASIGGAIRMNAGGKYGCIGDAIETVTCIGRNGELVTYPKSELTFTYRQTNIPDPIIIAATFRVTPTDPIALREKVKDIFSYKKSTQPLADHSAGCTFKNPIDPETGEFIPAGKLIDRAGLKGYCIGGATVSTHHANFIVTNPSATASDVMRLLAEVRKRVFDHSGIQLEQEVVIWRRKEEDTA